MRTRSESLLLSRIEKTMPGRPACEGLPPSTWVQELRQAVSETDAEDTSTQSEFFKALGEPIRLKIAMLLAKKGELCACEVQAALDLSQSLSSHHLNVLKWAGIATSAKKGKWVHYGLERGVASILEKSNQLLK